MHQSHDHPHTDAHRHAFDSPEQVAFAELEAEVLTGLMTRAVDALGDQCGARGVRVRRVLDLGSGPGVGTLALAERFPDAQVVAVDGSAAMLHRVTERAERLGQAARVTTMQADLDTALGELGPADVVWSSMALHHVADEATALRRVAELLEPGGLLTVVEQAGPVHALPDSAEAARPGLDGRLAAAWAAWFVEMRSSLPGAAVSAGYPEMLAAAGFEVLVDRLLDTVVPAPPGSDARRFAHRQLAGTRTRMEQALDPLDLEVLDTLVDEHHPEGILRRDDVALRTSRQLYVAATTEAPLSAGATPPADRTRSGPGRP